MLSSLLETKYWPARWYCGQWSDLLGWTHIISDTLIFLAYLAIPCLLAYFYLRIKNRSLDRIFILFALFILFCGTGHLIEAIIFYRPVYRFAAVWKAMTAIVSWATVIALIPYVTKLLRTPKLQLINDELYSKLQNERQKLEEFSYRVAHDLKEPIRGIGTYSKIILSDEDCHLTPNSQQKVEKIYSLSQQSYEMIDRMLDYCTQEIKNNEFVDIEKMLQELLLEVPDPEKKIQISIADQMPQICGNAVTLKEAFRNIIMNSVKYNDKEKTQIKIDSKIDSKRTVFEISDNGPGVSESHLKELFEMKRINRKRHKNSGTGLGMQIIKKTMDQHQGKVSVESELGKGTTFFLSFPRNTTK